MATLDLPFGRTRVRVSTGASIRWLRAPDLGPAPPVAPLLEAALDAPVDSAPLEARVRSGDRVTLIVSDATRDEPRAALVDAVRARLPEVRLTLAIATGTHGSAGGLDALGLRGVAGEAAVVDHDGHDPRALIEVGTTARGTPVVVHRAVTDADLVIATGVIRPHYFAGFGAGAKAVFPGLASSVSARTNHRWKTDPGSRPGALDDNPCRLDIEEAAALAAPALFILDGVADGHGLVRGAVAGDAVAALRAGARLAMPWVSTRAAPSRWIVVTDEPPVTDSLYQASKCVAAVAPLVAEGGTVVLVAPCRHGVGPVDVVNRAIYDIGLRPRLPRDHRVVLVSDLDRATVEPSYASWAPSIDDAVRGADQLLVVESASKVVIDVER